MSFVRRAAIAGKLLLAGVVVLSLATAYIHLTLGSTSSLIGLLFLANAAGYATLAAGVLATSTISLPIVRRFAWAPRVALAAFTAATIVGYLVIGPYFMLGWITKAIEVAILALLMLDAARLYGSPLGMARAALASFGRRASVAADGV